MGQADWDDDGNRGPLDDDYYGEAEITCKRCGKEGLTWYRMYGDKFRLYETRPGTLRLQFHRCKPADLVEGEFEDVGE